MEELIKIAENGQWTLEKSKGKNNPEVQRMIEEFMARKKGTASPQSQPTPPKYPAGLQPAAVSTMDYKGANNHTDPGHRADIQRMVANREDAAGPQVIERKFDRGAAPATQVKPTGKLSAEEAGPMEMRYDPESKQKKMFPRVGRFHGEGATTTGKIINRAVGFENQKSGERGFRRIPQQEQHHWSWDDNKKKWDHVKTSHISPTSTGGGISKPTVVETVKRTAGTSAPQERADWAASQLKDK